LAIAATRSNSSLDNGSANYNNVSIGNNININNNNDNRGLNINDFIKSHYGSILHHHHNNHNTNHNNTTTAAATTTTNSTTGDEESSSLSLLAANASEYSYYMKACNETASLTSSNHTGEGNNNNGDHPQKQQWTLRRIALELSLWLNVFITLTKLVAYCRTLSLSVLAALLDSVLDVVSQIVLNYTEKHSSMQRSSALYPAGASRLEPIGVLTCAALMGMASFEVLKESFETLLWTKDSSLASIGWEEGVRSAISMAAIVVVKLFLLWLCNYSSSSSSSSSCGDNNRYTSNKSSLQYSDPTLEAVAQDHWNDALSNGVSAVALLLALYAKELWWCDGVGAIGISLYIIYSWYETGKEQIEHLTGKSAPDEFLDELTDLAEHFDDRLLVDTCRAYHFGPKFLVELEVVMPMDTLLKESHDLGMELQYEIEARAEVERCFVHIDYESREYDEHVVSKVPLLREHLLRHRQQQHHHHHKTQNSAMSV
jgi:cation diffusion facilitator family transporter